MSSGNFVRRFANPNRTEELALGECRCPGTPHEGGDLAVIRVELGSGEEARAGAYGWTVGGEYFDWEAARDKLIEIGVVRWNLVDDDGDPLPVTAKVASLLDTETRGLISGRLDELSAARASLPNGQGARSRRTSRTSASRTRRRTA